MPNSSPNPTAGQGRAAELTLQTPKPTLPPRKFRILDKCQRSCTLNVANHSPRTASLIHAWYEEGWNNFGIMAKAALLDTKLSHGSVARHRANHLEVIDPDEVEEEVSESENQKLSDVQILDRIIRQGSKQLNSKGAKISPEMTMRAMELKYKLTQGSVMEDTFAAIARAMGGENPAAAQSEEETAQQFSDAAPEAGPDGGG